MAKPRATVGHSKEALAWFRERVPLTDRQLSALEHRAEKRAFRVAGVTQLRVVDQVMKALDNALARGTTLDDFKKQVRGELLPQWQGTVANPSARMETIFRTNLQSAYSAGRYREMLDPDSLAVRPYWRFTALLDLRTSEICKQCDGTVGAADSGWFKSHMPPLHFSCRSAVRPITTEEAQERGITRHVPQAQPDHGFGTIQDADGEHRPDLSGVTPELRAAYEAKALAHKRRERQ